MKKWAPRPQIPAFAKVWRAIFTTPVHLDSALSGLDREVKDAVARAIHPLLRQPVSLAEALGVGMEPGEPWNKTSEELAEWKPAFAMAEAMFAQKGEFDREPPSFSGDYPPDFIESWTRSFGPELTEKLCSSLTRSAPLGVRVGHRALPSAVVKEIRSSVPVKAEVSDLSPIGLRLSGYAPVKHLAPFERGDCDLQDEGSQLMALFAIWPDLVAPFLTAKPGRYRPSSKRPMIQLPEAKPAWTVVDACAGAGGKSLALAHAMGGKGRVYAYDVAAVKLQALGKRAQSEGLHNIQTLALERHAERAQIDAYLGQAQAVLVDAPCSGWGVLRRNPDLKWRRSAERLATLPALQLRILETYAHLTAVGSRLTYGVCTFNPSETTEVIDAFCKSHPEFEPCEGGFLGPDPCDGFFMQSFKRTSLA